jgi:HlyD family secretion protein
MKTLLTLVILVLIAGVVGAYCWYGVPEPQKFRTLPVERGDLFIGTTATGKILPVVIDVPAAVAGRVTSLGPDRNRTGQTIDYNSLVKEGDVLAQLGNESEKADRDSAAATVKMQEAELLQAKVRERQAERDFRRAEKLRDTESKASHEAAESQYETARANRAMSEARLEQAQIALKQAEIKLGYTTVRSPIDGQVMARRVEVGQTVAAGTTLFLLEKDPGHLQIWSAVDQADIGDISVGQKVTFKVDACHDRVFVGKVTQRHKDAGMLGSVVTYGVIIDVDNTDGKLTPYAKDGKLQPYMIADLRFEVAHCTGVLLIPTQALRWRPTWEQVSPVAQAVLKRPVAKVAAEEKKAEGDADEEPKVEVASPTVWLVANDGLVRPVAVKVGLSDGLVTELTGGELSAGSAVVVNAPRPVQPDFVSGFIAKVLKK